MIQEQKPKKPPRKKPKPSAMTRPPKRNKKKKKPPPPKHLVTSHSHHQNMLSHNNPQQEHLNQHNQQSSSIPQNTVHTQQQHPPKFPQLFNQKNLPMMKYIVNGPGYSQGKNLKNSTNQVHISAQTLASKQHAHQQKIIMIPGNTQDVLNVCENSSAYESSEDTGVGGLSESEIIHHDVIGVYLFI